MRYPLRFDSPDVEGPRQQAWRLQSLERLPKFLPAASECWRGVFNRYLILQRVYSLSAQIVNRQLGVAVSDPIPSWAVSVDASSQEAAVGPSTPQLKLELGLSPSAEVRC